MNRLFSCCLAAAILVCASAAFAVEYRFTKIALSGELAPGTAGGLYSSFAHPVINNNGKVAYRAHLSVGVGDTTGANENGIWTSDGFLVRSGDFAAGTMGATYGFVEPGSINDFGVVAYYGVLNLGVGDTRGTWGDNNLGLWTSEGLLARSGDVAPGTAGAIYGPLSVPSINNVGNAAYAANLVTGLGDSTSENNFAIWTKDDGLLVRKGDTAIGTSGATYLAPGAPTINDDGTVVYGAQLNVGQGDTTLSNNFGVWTSNELVSRAGDLAAGTTDTYDEFVGPVINQGGAIAYYAVLNSVSDNVGIWTTSGLIARAGQTAIGTSGAVYDAFERAASLNDAGQVAFLGGLKIGVGDTTGFNNFGIWTSDDLVVRAGDVVEVAPGDFRVVATLGMGRFALANTGQVAFLINFLDGTQGVFVATPVPEPGALVLLAIVALPAVLRAVKNRFLTPFLI